MTPPDSGELAAQLRILTPGLTAEEIAAVTAVVSLAVEEISADQVPEPDLAPARWRGGGALRRDLGAARGSWGHSLR